jgi:O-antigen/teichoic acid export membrane protein
LIIALINRLLHRAGVQSRIARNSIFLLGAEATSRMINLLLQVLLSRYLGPKNVGTLTFIINYTILFSIIAELGVTRVAIREIASGRREEAGRILGSLTGIRIISGVVMVAAIWGSLFTPLSRGATDILIYLFSFSILFQSLHRNYDVIFYAFERMKFVAMLQVLNRLTAACIILGAMYLRLGLATIIIAYVSADFVDLMIAALIVRRLQPADYRVAARDSMRLLVLGIPFALQMFAGQI